MTNREARGVQSVTVSEAAGMVRRLGVDSYRLALKAVPGLVGA